MFFDHHFIGMHWIWWLILVGIFLLLVFNILPYKATSEMKEDALNILKKRFARGEIEREEFEERKQILKRSE